MNALSQTLEIVVLDPIEAPGQHARLLAGEETMQATYPGFAVLYKWRLHPGSEESFVQAWSRMTDRLRSERGSLGSRLHRGADGFWYSYAQWPSAKARDDAFA